ncbi:MAG: hypothetical protein Q4G52_11050, partial [Clostridia bacterium]|nr:hypothetical protein [Clostridia bacterium]
ICKTCGMACVHSYDEKGVCTICGYACAHPQENRTYTNPHEVVLGYTANNQMNHSTTYGWGRDEMCGLCGVPFGTEIVEGSEYVVGGMPHTFVDGVCSLCGQEACKHPSDSVRLRTTTINISNTPLDERYHTKTYDVVEQSVCEECYEVISERVLETGKVDKVAHYFSAEGSCYDCQYQLSCAHANVVLRANLNSTTSYEPVDEIYHMHYYDVYGNTFCTDCGQAVKYGELIQQNLSEKEQHHFSDGVCLLCGTSNTCTHPSTRVEEYISGNSVMVDETYCARTGKRVIQTYCTVCQSFVKTEEIENVTQTEKHNFYDGACTYCGYVPECSHERTYVTTQKEYYASGVPKDDKVHVSYYNRYEWTYCADCEKLLSQKLVEQNCEMLEAHHFETGVQCTCGYISLCNHSNVKKAYYNSGRTSVTGIDDKRHAVQYDSYSYDVCADCGANLGNDQLINYVQFEEEHDYRNGVCRTCGYVSGCQHANTHTEMLMEGTGSRRLDGKYHIVLNNWYELTKCSNCGETLDEKLVETGDEKREQHHYDDLGVCVGCGYVNAGCKHETVSATVRWDSDSAQVVSKDENGHTVTYDVIKTTHCYDCGLDMTEVIAQGQTVTEPHNGRYWDSVCTVCHYDPGQPACQHPTTEEVVSYACQSILSTDEQGHTMKAIKSIETYCAECGTWIRGTEEPGQTVTEAHDFYLDKCMVCDYKNPCKHAQTHTENYYDRQYNFSSTADGHTFKGDLWEMTICDVCDSVIAEALKTFDGTFTDVHYFNDKGVCLDCGYKGGAPVKPEPTPGPTAKPTQDTDTTFVPTPRPQTNTAVEPTVEPTATPAPQAMVDTLLEAVLEAQAEGSEVTVEVVGAAEIMTEEEYTALKALPAQEQILVTLASIGFEDVVEAAMKALNVTLSDGAQALVQQVSARMAAVSDEERAAIEEKLAQYFPVEEVVVDGVKTSYFVIDLRIEVDGVVRVERYGFRLDENGEWIFVRLDLQSVQW